MSIKINSFELKVLVVISATREPSEVTIWLTPIFFRTAPQLTISQIRNQFPFQTLFVLAALYVIAVQLFDPASMRLSQQAEIDFSHETLQKNIKELKQEAGSRKALQLLEKSAFYADSARIV